MAGPKILFFDIETAPSLSYVWGMWEQNVIEVKQDWRILCFAAKWQGRDKIFTSAQPDFKGYKKDLDNDYHVVKALWDLLDEADILIAHNGDEFDVKKANARFIAHQLPPPSPYLTIDTKKLAKRHFKFDSNSLDELARYLGLGRKEATHGFKTWKGCMSGDPKSWKVMLKYNKQDVRLLEEVYNKLRPWSTNHPNVNVSSERLNSCPVCSGRVQKRGYSTTRINKKQRYHCTDCGAWSLGETIKTGIVIR